MIRAILLAGSACVGILGGVGLAVTSVVFLLKKQRRRSCVLASLALILGICGTTAAIQFAQKSFHAVDQFLVKASEASYDVDTPDTVGNRKGFERHFKMIPDEGVSQVYYYADEFGADVRYQLSFKCDNSTVDQIIAKLVLTKKPGNHNGLTPRDDLIWWTPNSTKNRSLWTKEKQNEYYWELWYSEKDNIVFYHEYSM